MVLQCLIRFGGILSLPGALSAAEESIALLNSSMVGSASNSSITDMRSMASRAAGATVLSLD